MSHVLCIVSVLVLVCVCLSDSASCIKSTEDNWNVPYLSVCGNQMTNGANMLWVWCVCVRLLSCWHAEEVTDVFLIFFFQAHLHFWQDRFPWFLVCVHACTCVASAAIFHPPHHVCGPETLCGYVCICINGSLCACVCTSKCCLQHLFTILNKYVCVWNVWWNFSSTNVHTQIHRHLWQTLT